MQCVNVNTRMNMKNQEKKNEKRNHIHSHMDSNISHIVKTKNKKKYQIIWCESAVQHNDTINLCVYVSAVLNDM